VFEGVPTRDVLRVVGVNRTTLWRWRQLPVWGETSAELARQVREQVVPLAHQVIVEGLRAELGHGRRRPNPKLALEVLDRFDPAVIRDQGQDEVRGGAGLAHWIVEFPIRDRGLESKPPTQVLVAPTPIAPPATEPLAPPERRGKRMARESRPRRRVAGPDE